MKKWGCFFMRKEHTKRRCRALFLFFGLLLSSLSWGFSEEAGKVSIFNKDTTPQKKSSESSVPFFLRANSVSYDMEKKIFRAKGNVVIHNNGYHMKADMVQYEENTDRITAWGDLFLEDSQGNIFFGDRAELTGDFKNAFVSHIRGMTKNREHITAQKFIKKGNIEEFEMASYSPCERCKDETPVWEMYARFMKRDLEKNTLQYTDTHLDFLGTTVAYLPYWVTPLKRCSGFLAPGFSSTKELGLYLGVPYYLTLGQDKDFTFTPYLTTVGGIIFAEDYRQRFNNGSLRLQGAINFCKREIFNEVLGEKVTKTPSIRGYVHGELPYDLNEHWRLRINEWWVSDKTFLSTRPFFGKTTAAFLESQSKIEGFYTHHFFCARGMHYQGLRKSDEDKRSPVVYPELFYSYTSPPLWMNSTIVLNANALLYQKYHNHIQRAVCEGKWECPLFLSGGQEVTFFGYLKVAEYFYNISMAKKESLGEDLDSNIDNSSLTGWVFPQIGATYKWPIFFSAPFFLLTPQVQILYGPSIHQSSPNIDSWGVTYSDTNMLVYNRFPGYDAVDEGGRVDYGLSSELIFSQKNQLQFFIGQSYAITQPNELLEPVGVRKGFSDLIGCVRTIFHAPNCQLLYRTRLDNKTFKIHFQEVLGQFGPKQFLVRGAYTFQRQDPTFPEDQFYNQMLIEVSSQFTKFWSATIFITQNFQGGSLLGEERLMDKGISIAYEDECFAFGIKTQYSYYKFNDLRPGLSLDIFLNFKNIGGFRRKIDRFAPIWSTEV